MPLNKLDNFLKNVEGRILYVSPSDLDASDAMSNQGNSQTTPFKTIQRALIEAARFSYVPGNNNDITEKTTILLMPGDHIIDNRPGYKVQNDGGLKVLDSESNEVTDGVNELSLNLESNFDLTQEDNILRKFNSKDGGVIVPRGTSIVGLDLRKTKIRPKYVPNPTDPEVPNSAIFRITGACYFWQFSIFDGKLSEKVYTDNTNFDTINLVKPSFSHHKLTCFEYADGVNKDTTTGLTDLNMYYYKLSIAYGSATEDRDIPSVDKFPTNTEGFVSKRPEFEIVGAFANDPLRLTSIQSGDGATASSLITVTTQSDHGLDVGTPIRIKGVGDSDYNVSTTVTGIDSTNPKVFTYVLTTFKADINVNPDVSDAQIIVETDTVNGASPYIFNISLRSVFGMNGMHADGSKATGFRSMVVAQFTGVSLQKDDRAFVKYDSAKRQYDSLDAGKKQGAQLANESSAQNSDEIYHLDSDAIYRSGWETRHVKISNNSILQIVSVFAIGYGVHFEAQSGSDASITNSNSNFGQLALVSDGFRKDAFNKDDRAFITHIIPPRAITTEEENIDWLSIDQNKKGDSTKLYLFGFESEDIKPPSLTQGFRIGAKRGDKLFVDISGEKEASIRMDDGTATPSVSSIKQITISTQANGLFTSPSNHLLLTGEKVIVISDDGDLPENIEEKTVYFAIVTDGTKFKLASSKTNADNGEFITAYGGTNLKVLSRVTDKESGDVGHPVQYDGVQWYINVSSTGNTITGALSGSTGRTEPSFVKRISDTRSLDEKIYRLRLAIPKEIDNSKNPENGFVLQESANTGVTVLDDFIRTEDLTTDDFLFERNPRFISSCTFQNSTKIVTITSEKPHNLTVGDLITVKNIKDSSNTTGLADKGYNGEFTVTSVPSSMKFTYSTKSKSHPNGKTIGDFGTNDFNTRVINYPRFERTDLKSNIYVFRNNIISEYINDIQDGVYQIFPLNSSNFIPTEYTGLNYSQNVVDLYPQLDRDNIDENPQAAKSFAVRSPLGQVVTNDPLKSITRETNDKLITKIGFGPEIFSFTDSTTTGIVSFTTEHNIGGIVKGTLNNGSGSGFTNGTYLNVKVFNDTTQNNDSWNGTLSKVIVGGGNVTSFEITNAGSGWQVGQKGYFDTSVVGVSTSAYINDLTADDIGVAADLVLQATGIGTTSDSYFRITAAPSKREVTIAKTSGDVNPIAGQYGFVVSPSAKISSGSGAHQFFSATGITSVTTVEPHGLVAGNRFQLNDANNNNQGTFIVKSKISPIKFEFKSITDIVQSNGYILKHGLSANDGESAKGNENLSIRGVELFDNENSKLETAMDRVGTVVTFSTSTSNVISRFPFGSYIVIDEEIMRVSSKTVGGGASNNVLTVLRGVFGTLISSHAVGSLIKKIKPFPIQFNRPSILRASGHTFEYLGYGPGNYSTALPQVQVKTISEKEEFLSQSQERSSGAVVYTGMNNKGDFYIGNQKKSALTGEEISFDTPIPSVAGEDPGRLSVVFDETTIKERLIVEGGKSKTSLSEFDGPVNFNNEVQIKGVDSSLKIKSTLESTSSATGSLVISGGVGIAKTVNLPDNAAINFGNNQDLKIFHDSDNSFVEDTGTGALKLKGSSIELIHGSSGILTTTSTGAMFSGILTATSFRGDGSQLDGINSSQLLDSGSTVRAQATTDGITVTDNVIANGGTFGNVEVGLSDDQTINTSSGNLVINCAGSKVEISKPLEVTGTITSSSDIIAFSSSDITLKKDISPIQNALDMVNNISGNTFTWNTKLTDLVPHENGTKDTGILAQEIEALGLPGVTITRGDGVKAVRYDRLIPVLIEAIKELTKKVDSLENK